MASGGSDGFSADRGAGVRRAKEWVGQIRMGRPGGRFPEGGVVALGDSITRGDGLKKGAAYPAVLRELLNEPVLNSGISGNTAVDGLQRLDRDALRYRPRAVVISFGINDSGVFSTAGKAGLALERYQRALVALVKRVREAGAVPLLASLTPVDARAIRDAGLQPGNWDAYDAELRGVAERQAVTLVDLAAAFGGDVSLLRDGVHPSEMGANRIARAVAGAMPAWR